MAHAANVGDTSRDPQDATTANPFACFKAPAVARLAASLARLAAIGAIAACLGACHAAHTGRPIAQTKHPAPTALRIDPQADGLFCAQQIVWSPDATRIAVLGSAHGCSGAASGRTPGLIHIYAAATGKLMQALQPDSVVLAQPPIAHDVAAATASGGTISTLTYHSLIWTPDDQALVMVFDLELQPNANAGSTGVYGLERIGVTDPSRTAVWLDTSASTFAPSERWDLTTGATATEPAPAHAAAYQWRADGMLAPMAPTSQAVGSPDGGAMFTVWQPGDLRFATISDKATESTTVVAQDVGWVSDVAPISPDGRYFYPNVTGAGSLFPPSEQKVGSEEPILAPHDQALVALAQKLMQTPNLDQNTHMLVAWRPDGAYLAAITPDAETPNPAAYTVSIYDTAHAQLVEQLKPNFAGLSASPTTPGTNLTLSWAPDGSRLLLVDNLYGEMTIWEAAALPA